MIKFRFTSRDPTTNKSEGLNINPSCKSTEMCETSAYIFVKSRKSVTECPHRGRKIQSTLKEHYKVATHGFKEKSGFHDSKDKHDMRHYSRVVLRSSDFRLHFFPSFSKVCHVAVLFYKKQSLKTQLKSPVENIMQHQKIWTSTHDLGLGSFENLLLLIDFLFFFFLATPQSTCGGMLWPLWMWGFNFLDSSWCVGKDLYFETIPLIFMFLLLLDLWAWVIANVPIVGIFTFHWNQSPCGFYTFFFNRINKKKHTQLRKHLVLILLRLLRVRWATWSIPQVSMWMPRRCLVGVARLGARGAFFFGVKILAVFFQVQPVRCCLGSFGFFFINLREYSIDSPPNDGHLELWRVIFQTRRVHL